MSMPGPLIAKNRVEAATDRVMLLWSMIRMVPDHDLTRVRFSLVEALSEQRHLTEDQLVIVGLKYLYQNVRPKTLK
jgi:hypothetical protein